MLRRKCTISSAAKHAAARAERAEKLKAGSRQSRSVSRKPAKRARRCRAKPREGSLLIIQPIICAGAASAPLLMLAPVLFRPLETSLPYPGPCPPRLRFGKHILETMAIIGDGPALPHH